MIRTKKIITFLFLVTASLVSIAQSENSRVANYISTYRQLAIDEMIRTGVPASITLAQGILETAGGQSDLAEIANNHFGIKCKSEWTGETMIHDDDRKNECFRKYPSATASFQDHSDFLRNRPNYAFLFKLDPTDYEGWAKGLKKAGYATNPTYAQKLMKIIVENNLQETTLFALNAGLNNSNNLFALKEKQKEADVANTVQNLLNEKITFASTAPVSKVGLLQKNTGLYPLSRVFLINETRVVYSPAGTSLLALANQYNISYKKILEFNELDGGDILSNDQLIFVQKKPKKGSRDIHIVEHDETLHDICQKEGIQLASLLELNRLQKGTEPAQGENLYLKFPAPISPKLAKNQNTFMPEIRMR